MSGPYWTRSEDRPNVNKNPLAWERSWERDFTRVLSHWKWTRGRLSDLMPKEAAMLCCGDSSTLALGHHTRHLVGLQGRFAKEAAEAFATRDFERRWRDLSQDSRRQFILQGICSALSDPDADVDRPWCPDSTLTSLSSRNGEALLDMMKLLIPQDLLSPLAERDPIFPPHPIIDRIFTLTEEEERQPGFRSFAYNTKISRARLLTEIVYNVLLIFYGRKPLQRGGWNGHSNKYTVDSVLRDLPESIRNMESVRSKAEAIAANSDPPSKKRKTSMLGLRACQTKDWKTGYHKQICGRTLSEDDLIALTEGLRLVEKDDKPDFVTNRYIPKPDPGYTHTPALTHQILTLSRVKGAQYVIFHPDLAQTEPDHPYLFISLEDTKTHFAFYFLIFRNRAFMTGDREAVRAMYTLLTASLWEPDAAASTEHVQKQLETEFNVDLSDGVFDLVEMILGMEDPTTEEATRAELDLAWQKILPTDP